MKKEKPTKKVKPPTQEDKNSLRLLVRTRDDIQAQRKSLQGRLGLDADNQPLKIAPRSFQKGVKESLVALLAFLIAEEARLEAQIKEVLKLFPISKWMKKVNGCGPVSQGQILSVVNIEIATTVSKLWQYSGLNPDLVRGKKRIETRKPLTYESDKGWDVVFRGDPKKHEYYVIVLTDIPVRGDRLTQGFVAPFNKKLRTALCGVMATSMHMAGLRYEPCSDEDYAALPEHMRELRKKKIGGKEVEGVKCRKIIKGKYVQRCEDTKHRLAHSEKLVDEICLNGKIRTVMWKDATPAHRHRAGIRAMIKLFLQDLYAEWRKLEGLEVRLPYDVAKLGHRHVTPVNLPPSRGRKNGQPVGEDILSSADYADVED